MTAAPIDRTGVYTRGTVHQCLEREKAHADAALAYWYQHLSSSVRSMKQESIGMEYHGPEVRPFEAYIRWGLHRVVLASISHLDNHTQQGRMVIIMSSLERLRPVVDVECVGNPHLAKWLHRNGYRPVIDPGESYAPYPTNYRKRDGITPPDFYYGTTLDEERQHEPT